MIKVSIAGKKFGRLLVLDDALLGPKRDNVLVRCDCGREFESAKHNITRGKTKSCGIDKCNSSFKDETGKQWGYLTAIRHLPYEEKTDAQRARGAYWECQCVCGNKVIMSSHDLRVAHTKSCGCKKGLLSAQAMAKEPGHSNMVQVYANYRRNAQNKDREFKLSFEEFKNLASAKCFYCGTAPTNVVSVISVLTDSGKRDLLYNGVDRVDNSKGYTIDNCVSCCKKCNYAKHTSSHGEFIQWLDELVRFRQNLLEKKVLQNTESVK